MYKLSLPIQNRSVNSDNRAIFTYLCKKAGIDRVFLTASPDEDLEKMKLNIRLFKEAGFEVGIWVGSTIGHGSTLLDSHDDGKAPTHQRLVNFKGTELYGTCCPLDEGFKTSLAERLTSLANLGTDMIMIDDDYRLSQHGDSPCCCCELHMARIRKYCGDDISREQLQQLAFSGKRNKYRDAWMRAQAESLEELAAYIREELDKVNPDVSISACSAYCSWDLDGTDPIRLTKIFAGKNKAFLRLHGAPYWAMLNNKPVEAIPEIERMFASFCQGEDIEIFSEGDVYPRSRYNVPSASLDIMDGALRADGHFDGILKYMLNYSPLPLYETGYIDRHCRNMGKLADIQKFFKNGANAGVKVLIKPHLLNDTDFSISSVRQQSPYPTAGIFLAANAIPTVYSGDGICSALFGENARHFDVDDFKEGAILDAVAAQILTERGIDVGIKTVNGWTENGFGNLKNELTGFSTIVIGGKIKRFCCDFNEGVKYVLTYGSEDDRIPMAYKYENADGQKFLVFTFSADALPSYPKFIYNNEFQAALISEIEWIAKKPLPAITRRAPELYTLCEKGEDYTSVALFNCFFDSTIDLEIELDREYKKVEFSNCTGHIEGNKVILDSEIHAFDFASFKAYN